MNVEFRQRTAGELIGILKRQKWMIILPIITFTAAIGYVVALAPAAPMPVTVSGSSLPSLLTLRTLISPDFRSSWRTASAIGWKTVSMSASVSVPRRMRGSLRDACLRFS